MFFKKRRQKREEAEREAAEARARASEPLPEELQRTVFLVGKLRSPRNTDTWHGSWQSLSDKVYSWLKRNYRQPNLPYGTEFDDLFCSLLARMVRDLPQLEVRGRDAFWGWVKTLTEHQISDFWRRHKRQRRGGGVNPQQQTDEDNLDVLSQVPDEKSMSASMVASLGELEQAEQGCIEQLPNEEARQVYVDRRIWGLSYEEIAQKLEKKSTDAVRLMYGRIRDRIRACLREKLDGYAGAGFEY